MRTAIVYDRVNKIGGAERVLESLAEMFPGSTLFTSVYDKTKTPWAKRFKVETSILQKIPFLNKRHEFIPYLMPFAFEFFKFDDFDLVISVTSESAKGIIVPPGTPHVCICLTPTRYLWSGYNAYFKNIVLKIFTYPIVWYLRKWDLAASRRPDNYIAISENVRKRIKKYYKRDSMLIHPPSDRLFNTKKRKKVTISEKDYFLVVSRLVDYKRIDLAIKACTKLRLPLIVIGEGSEYEKLDSIAGETVVFKGRVGDDELIEYYKNCRALIFPGEEDFGITMVEVQLAGKPVIAYAGGGALEIVTKNTGIFFNNQSVKALCDVLLKFNNSDYNREDCMKNAQRFSEEKFKKSIRSFLKDQKYL